MYRKCIIYYTIAKFYFGDMLVLSYPLNLSRYTIYSYRQLLPSALYNIVIYSLYNTNFIILYNH